MSDLYKDLAAMLELKQSDAVISTDITRDELTVVVTPAGLLSFVAFLKSNSACQFTTLIDITAVDYPAREKRFEVVYFFLSMVQNQRIRVKINVEDGVQVASITDLYSAANWSEREVFDMFGITFSDHPDLRRLLTDYGFEGHPLRKDFPTTGYVEIRYDEAQKRCIYEPVTLTQEYRQFDFMSPWEGAEYILPGDEKKET
ncbi:MAG: NADH-quinone oxidoreductase subunit C [Paracoccaceae bacterium]